MAASKMTREQAVDFIEAMREEAVPGYKASVSTKKQPPDPKPPPGGMSQTVQPDEQIQPDNPAILPAYLKEEEKYADFEMTPEELDFIKSFVVSSSLQGVTTNGITVKIRREHHTVIQEILKHLLVGSSVTAYIDNVLAEHIKKYYPLIMDIIRKCPSKLQ